MTLWLTLHETRSTLDGGVRSARAAWAERRHLLVTLRDEAGHVALGEASPLPGVSTDSLDACRAALDLLSERPLAEPAAPPGRGGVLEQLRVWGEQVDPGVPAARFALETALLGLLAQRHGTPRWALLAPPAGGEPPGPLPLAKLLGRSDDATLEQDAIRALGEGYRTLKIKIGAPGGFDAELRRLQALRGAVGRDVALRLDANQAFAPEQASAYLARLAVIEPELVEEPCAGGLPPEVGPCPVPLGLDESLHGPAPRSSLFATSAHLAERSCVAWMLKPMALGGVVAAAQLAARARHLGLEPVFTHLFDGAVALSSTADLALAFGSRRLAHGLAPHRGLSAVAPSELLPIRPPWIVAAR